MRANRVWENGGILLSHHCQHSQVCPAAHRPQQEGKAVPANSPPFMLIASVCSFGHDACLIWFLQVLSCQSSRRDAWRG